ncbi:MAG: DUF5317 domain-containing protein [Firmicutes bacterium]|nr:DUF5317 domain-containing protein [Bacillota bacterium]
MLADAVILALIIGFLRGGRLKTLGDFTLKGAWIAGLALALRMGLTFLGLRGNPVILAYGGLFQILSYLLLLGVVWANRRTPWMNLIGAGILLNFLVIVTNGGHMPVSLEGLRIVGLEEWAQSLETGSYVTHVAMNAETRIPLLADRIPVPSPYPHPRLISLGDLGLAAGIFLLIQGILIRPVRRDSEHQDQTGEALFRRKLKSDQ